MCVQFFFSELIQHIYCLETFELIRALCIFFFFLLFFCGYVNNSLNLDEDTLHRNTVAVRKEPIMTINETFTCIVCDFSTSSGCLKSGAFFCCCFGQVSVGAFNVNINPEVKLVSFTSSLSPFFLSICCQRSPSWYISVHLLCDACLSSCENIF